MTAAPARIRWEDDGANGFRGYVGSLEPCAFAVWKYNPDVAWWTLTGHLGAMRDQPAGDDPGVLKAAAERWLEEFAASIGALFPVAAAALPEPNSDGIRDLVCGSCGGEFGTNFSVDEIDCPHCDARRCPTCGDWFAGR